MGNTSSSAEKSTFYRKTKLSMIVDPPNQSPSVTGERVRHFLQKGGNAVFVGGSGFIDPEIFEHTIEAVTTETLPYSEIPVWILPGDLGQIPNKNYGIAGVLNYVDIIGSHGEFTNTYPSSSREFVTTTLASKQLKDISTLYILCGDKNASVSRVSGILPVDFSHTGKKKEVLSKIDTWLQTGVECIFFEAGSNSSSHTDEDIVFETRELIDKSDSKTMLVVSGGITSPEQVALFSGIADIVNIGGYFERNGTECTGDFVEVLTR